MVNVFYNYIYFIGSFTVLIEHAQQMASLCVNPYFLTVHFTKQKQIGVNLGVHTTTKDWTSPSEQLLSIYLSTLRISGKETGQAAHLLFFSSSELRCTF
jgi:hypothetical protein